MARIRSIKPEFCSSADVGALSREARLFFLQLLTEADDEGRMLWIPRRLTGVLYPFDDDVTTANLNAWAAECERRGMVQLYVVANVTYLAIVNWAKHQKIDHKSKSKLPAPEDDSRSPRDTLAKDSREPREGIAPDQGTGSREVEQGKEEEKSSLRSDSSSPAADNPPADKASEGKLTLTPPVDLTEHKTERLRQVTDDAITAYNARLGKPHGLLPAVTHGVGREKRQEQVRRCLRVARQICEQQFGSTTITPEFWEAYFAEVDQDPFRSGRQSGGKGHENWTPSFQYLTQADVVLDVFDRAMSAKAVSA